MYIHTYIYVYNIYIINNEINKYIYTYREQQGNTMYLTLDEGCSLLGLL